MRVILILLTILVAGGAIVWLIDRLFYHKQTAENADETVQNADDSDGSAHGCADDACGLRSICPSEQILAGECRQEVIYYDDEELDAFAGRRENEYTPDEEEQWPEDGAKAFRNGTPPRLWRGGLRSSSVLRGLVRHHHHSPLLGSGSAVSALSA